MLLCLCVCLCASGLAIGVSALLRRGETDFVLAAITGGAIPAARFRRRW